MNFKKTKVAVASGLMAASMVLAPLAAYAETSHTSSGSATEGFDSVYIKKTVKVADGVTIDSDVKFTVTKVNNTDGITTPADTLSKTEYTIDTSGKNNNSDGVDDFKYEDEVAINFNDLQTYGEYSFVVKEDSSALTIKGEGNEFGWTVNNEEYMVRVYVSNTGKKYLVQKGTYDNETETWKADETAKSDTAAFENTFEKRAGGSNDDGSKKAALTISKLTENNTYGDADELFGFTVKFEADTDSPAQLPETITPDGKKEYTAWTATGNDGEYTFNLKKDDVLTFTDLEAGIHWTVTENTFTNKDKTNVVGKANGETVGDNTTDQVTVGNQLLGENENAVTFTNFFKNVAITGVVTHSAPFVIMVGALFVAVGGYVVLKKRIEE